MSARSERRLSLDDSSGKALKRPHGERDVVAALAKLSAGQADYVILSEAKEEFVQVGGPLEYRHAGRHFRAKCDPAPAEVVEQVFLAYLRGEDWRPLAEWLDVTEALSRQRRRSILRIILAFVVLIALGALSVVLRWE